MMGGGAATDGCARHPGLPLPGAKRPRRREAGGAFAYSLLMRFGAYGELL